MSALIIVCCYFLQIYSETESRAPERAANPAGNGGVTASNGGVTKMKQCCNCGLSYLKGLAKPCTTYIFASCSPQNGVRCVFSEHCICFSLCLCLYTSNYPTLACICACDRNIGCVQVCIKNSM